GLTPGDGQFDIESQDLALASRGKQRRVNGRSHVPTPRPEAEAVFVLGRDRLARTKAARYDPGAFVQWDGILRTRLPLQAGPPEAGDDGGDNLVVDSLCCARPALVRGVIADLAFKPRCIAAIDSDHVGREGEIGDKNDLRFRFGACGLEAVAVNSAAV